MTLISRMPASVKPMLCTLVKEPFTAPGWLFENKFDGYRIVAFKEGRKVMLRSRSGLDYTARYPAIKEAVLKLKGNFIIDGEVVAFDEKGKVIFDLVQGNNPTAPLVYFVFDIIWKDGKSLKDQALTQRRKILKAFIKNNKVIKVSEVFNDGIELFKKAEATGLEGIVAKRADSIYREGARSADWLKIPTARRQEFVIGGWAESEKVRLFRSILFGAYNHKGELEWIGRSGGGFKESEMPGILRKLKALEIKNSPFVNKILDTKGAVIHYAKPELVANFKFATWTNTGRIRKPAVFLGFRYDKKAKDVVREIPLSTGQEKQVIKADAPKPKSKVSAGSNWRRIDEIKIENEQIFEIEDCSIQLTNVDRELWKGVAKANLVLYYNSIAEYILPYLKDRPLSLLIKPNGPMDEGFYIKDMEGRQPECANVFQVRRKHPKAGKPKVIDYLVCDNQATLLWLINLGCIDINPWSSRTKDYLHADYIIIDLDPSDNDFEKVIKVAKMCKKFFDKHKLKAFIKTSGKTGMHILLPCTTFTFPQARLVAVNISKQIASMIPDMATSENTVAKRGDKVFIDYNQNDEADTIASVYSCRPSYLPTVSTPLDWAEVKTGLKPEQFTIETILHRLKTKGDLFKSLLHKKTMDANMRALQAFI
ncbi:DNA ligase D [Parafilimonas sp.]|uniref:DNA ligase D n=1 Tax=Parafilimonas sp. TaxID=1969739 RepID=UPI0039E4B41A